MRPEKGKPSARTEFAVLTAETNTIYKRERKVSIPERYIRIDASAFRGNAFMESCFIPSSVQRIDPGAFERCPKLTSIRFSKKSALRVLPERCFRDCTELADIALPDGLATIGAEAFATCYKIPEIEIPASVIEIGKDAFLHWNPSQIIHCHQHYDFGPDCHAKIVEPGPEVVARTPPVHSDANARAGIRRYYAVTCKCGHVGKENYVSIDFAVIAANPKQASAEAREIPRVKHEHPDAILTTREIDYEEYLAIRAQNRQDGYLHARNIQDQRRLVPDIDQRVKVEHRPDPKKKPDPSQKPVYDKKQRIANPKKYIRAKDLTKD